MRTIENNRLCIEPINVRGAVQGLHMVAGAEMAVDRYVVCLSVRRGRPLAEAFMPLAMDTARAHDSQSSARVAR